MPNAFKSEISTPPKQVRFVALVKSCGKPETVTLWTRPEENPAFMKAVRSNRVLTVTQNPTGSHLSMGEIGFHLKPSALFLVFPKSLPKITARVIGIKFDLIQDQPAKESSQKASAARKENKPGRTAAPAEIVRPKKLLVEKPASISLKQFVVTLLRSAISEEKITLRALNIHDAEAIAIKAIDKKRFAPRAIQNEIKAISEI